MMLSQEPVRKTTTPAGDPAWIVTGYHDVRTLLADPRLGRSHPAPERAARYSDAAVFGRPVKMSPEAERSHAARMRRVISQVLSTRRMTAMRPRVHQILDTLLDGMREKTPPADLHEAISRPLPTLVICDLLGVPARDQECFQRWSDDAADMTDATRSGSGLTRLTEYVSELVRQKQRQPAADVISDLIALRQHGHTDLTADQEVMLATGLLFAGHETTMTAIDRGAVLLLTHPAQREAMMRDATLVPGAAEEILRLSSSVLTAKGPQDSGLPRYANADIEIGGITIPAGDMVLLGIPAANLDARVFPAPMEFDVTRAASPHLTFGHGQHFCMGAPLARIELEAVAGKLFQRFPTLMLAVPADDLRPRDNLMTGGFDALPVTW